MALNVRVGIAGMGQGGTAVYKTLRKIDNIEIIVVCDRIDKTTGMEMARQDGVATCLTLEAFLEVPNLDVIIEATGLPSVQKELEQKKAKSSALIEAQGANLMMYIIEETEKLDNIKHLKGELDTILNSVQEAIEVAGIDGKIKYVNPSFSRVTAIPASQRIDSNIFEVSPEGALARALRTHKSVFAHRSQVGGSNVEVISNASPIIVDGKMEGAVVVFQPLTDIYKLMEQLKASNQVIDDLQSRINQISTSSYTFDDLIGSHPEFKSAVNLARKAAQSSSTVLITGESGTGKELFAHAIHSASARFDKPFIKVNCAAIPETLLESEFFGHEKGTFTGALTTKLGKMDLANGGTIFLDEIGDMNPYLQAKLLRVLQEMEFERVGGTKTIKVDVRVIAATNRNLLAMAKRGDFREDLYYRLNVIELRLPPLRNHKEDIPAHVHSLIGKFNRKFGKHVVSLTSQAEKLLMNYDWPGNIRELQNVMERAMLTSDEELISHKSILNLLDSPSPIPQEQGCERGIEEIMPMAQVEKHMIRLALKQFGDTAEGKKQAAKALEISLATLYNKLKTMT
jgi:transcriptional regulator with PAS, ATPase and Fis domain